MALENANFIPELVETNPDGSDLASTLDDHDRTIKRAIKGSFPGFVGTTATPKFVTVTEDQINDLAQRSASNTFTEANTFIENGNEILSLSDPQNGNPGAEVYSRAGTKRKVGFRNPIYRTIGSSRSLVQDDEGTIFIANGGITVTVEQLEPQTTMRLMVQSAGVLTLAQGAGVIIYHWDGLGGPQPSGNREIVRSGVVELFWRTATNVDIFGVGIT